MSCSSLRVCLSLEMQEVSASKSSLMHHFSNPPDDWSDWFVAYWSLFQEPYQMQTLSASADEGRLVEKSERGCAFQWSNRLLIKFKAKIAAVWEADVPGPSLFNYKTGRRGGKGGITCCARSRVGWRWCLICRHKCFFERLCRGMVTLSSLKKHPERLL